MESFLIAINTVAPLFILVALGYFIRHIGLLSQETAFKVNKLMFTIFFPILVFNNIYISDFRKDFNLGLLVFCFIAIVVQFLIGWIAVILTEKENSKRGTMLQGMFRSNFVLFGIPITASIFGDESTGVAAILIFIIIPVYNILAVLSLEMFNGQKVNVRLIFIGIVKNPLIIASAIGLLFLFAGITLPLPIYSVVNQLSQATTPMAFVVLGACFAFGDVGKYLKCLTITMFMKLIFFPAVFLFIAVLFGFREVELVVLITVFAAPIAVSSFSMAQQLGGDAKLAGQLVVFSTLISIITIFFLIFVFRELSLI